MEQQLRMAAEALQGAIRRTDVYRDYRRTEEKVFADPLSKSLVTKYLQVQRALQMASVCGAEPNEEDQQEFGRLNMVLFDHEAISEFLMAKMKYDQMIGELAQMLSDCSGDDEL